MLTLLFMCIFVDVSGSTMENIVRQDTRMSAQRNVEEKTESWDVLQMCIEEDITVTALLVILVCWDYSTKNVTILFCIINTHTMSN